MKTTIKVEKEVTITHVRIEVPVDYGVEDIPKDFPLRSGDVWKATVNIDTGKIENWPVGEDGHIEMKVCDRGSYHLLSYFGDRWESIGGSIIQDYVPHGVVPGSYGDYIELHINKEGVITNWPKRPDVSAFFGMD